MESVMLALLLANGFQEPPAAMHLTVVGVMSSDRSCDIQVKNTYSHAAVAWEVWQPHPRSHSGVRQGVDNVYALRSSGMPPAGTETMTVGCAPPNKGAWTVSAVVYKDGTLEDVRHVDNVVRNATDPSQVTIDELRSLSCSGTPRLSRTASLS